MRQTSLWRCRWLQNWAAFPLLIGVGGGVGNARAQTNVTAALASPAPMQNWNFHAQNTDIVQGYPKFSSAYQGANSLPNGGETRESVSLDVLAGWRLWPGAEAHVDGLLWQGLGLHDTLGAEGFPNGETFRLGTDVPNGAITRLFIRQSFGLGGEQEDVADDALDLAGKQDVNRITLTLGRFSAKDLFDNNAYANDPRTQFMNWGLMANEAWDYPADAIGFTTGLALEWNRPGWTFRYGVFQEPRNANDLTWEDKFFKFPYDGAAQDANIWNAWAMVTEVEHRYTLHDHPGTLRGLAFANRANMAEYAAATALLISNPGADYTTVRAEHLKYGFGLNWEQEVAKNVGVFSRLGWNDDREESWMFSDVGYAGSVGVSLKGAAWNRADDTYGLAGLMSGCSPDQRRFLAAGGTGILAGDGRLDYGWEKTLETYYDFKVGNYARFAVDYQFIDHPAFNQARGPVSVFGARLHVEF